MHADEIYISEINQRRYSVNFFFFSRARENIQFKNNKIVLSVLKLTDYFLPKLIYFNNSVLFPVLSLFFNLHENLAREG